MDKANSFKLEIVRPGKRHGQLISKLTNYVVLCDGADSDTISLPFDHYELRSEIRALRYFVGGGESQRPIPSPTRQDAVRRLSERLETVIAQMRGFQTRISQTGCAEEMTHIRLILGGSELSLIPFELATAPAGWRGAGNKILLQTLSPMVFTREIRGSETFAVKWNQQPRVLVISASPDGYSPPPLKDHVAGIFRALRPMIKTPAKNEPADNYEQIVTVLENASLEAIEQEMAKNKYTHVHVLCHGCPLPDSDHRFGLALAEHRSPHRLKPINGAMLANVLCGAPGKRTTPTMVMLASCDSANQNTVEAPGASIADHLHREGIPWVIASQLPLTYSGSVVLANVWYQGIFSGDDPRTVLYRLRQALYRQNQDNHDWASIVAYASFSPDFDEQVRNFCIAQLRRLIDSSFSRASKIISDAEKKAINNDEQSTHVNKEFCRIDDFLAKWKTQLPEKQGRNNADWGEFFGMQGAVAKQKAELLDEEEAKKQLQEAIKSYYKAAKAQIGNHWVIVQYLVLCKIAGENEINKGWYETAAVSAVLDEQHPDTRIWALGSLIELAILSEDGTVGGKSVKEWANEFKKETAPSSFEYFSTLRQLNRYQRCWAKLYSENVAHLEEKVNQALSVLNHTDLKEH